jgi:hypothetical protein
VIALDQAQKLQQEQLQKEQLAESPSRRTRKKPAKRNATILPFAQATLEDDTPREEKADGHKNAAENEEHKS